MLKSSIPAKFPIPWANNAGTPYTRIIPQASQIPIQAGAASLADGFPPLTMTPIAQGGVPPFGEDANGILKQITQNTQWANAGGLAIYDSVFASSIGGYPQGAIVQSPSSSQCYLNTSDNNLTNPDTGGAGWFQLSWLSIYNSVAVIQAIPIPTTTSFVATLGYATPGDGGGAFYIHASGSTVGGFQSSDGQWWQLATQRLTVEMFGGKGDGVTDNTSAMTTAHSSGKLIHYQTGTYLFSRISFAAGGIVGDGCGLTILQSTDTTSGDVITYTGSGLQAPGTPIPIFRDFALQCSSQAQKSGGAGLRFAPSSPFGQTAMINISNVFVFQVPIGIHFSATVLFLVQGCNIQGFSQYGIMLENTFNGDSGDSTIVGSNFIPGNSTGIGIEYRSSGGLKVDSCKFNGGAVGLRLNFNSPVNTGDLLIDNCSIENMVNQGIVLSQLSGASLFENILIRGCEIGICPIGIESDSSGAFVNLVITGCFISFGSQTSGGIVLTNINVFNITGNLITGPGTSTSSSGVSVTSCTNGLISSNMIAQVFTNVSVTGGSNVHTANNPT